MPLATRIEWTVATLRGMRPVTDAEPERIRVNVDLMLSRGQARCRARDDEWDELGLAQKISVIESLADWWPKEGVDP